MVSSKISKFQKKILDYYKKHGRDLPWRQTDDAYKILVSEIMLQQTQVERVIPKYENWLRKFPTIYLLARADFADVLRLWQGLGYNRRALALHRLAKTVVDEYHSRLPETKDKLKKLSGIGDYTAGAVCAFAFNQSVAMIETNIRRAFIDEFFKDKSEIHDKEILPLIEEMIYKKDPRRWYWALMDYGAMLGRTIKNPNQKSRHYAKQSKFEGSLRQLRGRILKEFSEKKKISLVVLQKNYADGRFNRVIQQLIVEGFLEKENDILKLR